MPAHNPRMLTTLIMALVLAAAPMSKIQASSTGSFVVGEDNRVGVDFAKFPWLGQLLIADTSSPGMIGRCSGTLISPRLVLTAGHCFSDEMISGDNILGKQATFLLQQSPSGQKSFRFGKVVAGAFQWAGFLQRHIDWALLRLDQPVDESKFPDLAALDEVQDIAGLQVSWYGYPSDRDDKTAFVHPMCGVAGWMSGKEAFYTYCDSATGESGGPITTLRNGKEVVVGIVSAGLQNNFLGFNFGSNLGPHLKQIRALIDEDKANFR